MENGSVEKLLQELRGQVTDLSAAVQLLTPLVQEQGGEREELCLAAMNKSLYRLVRTVYHLELCRREDHAFYPQVIDVAGLCRDIGRQVDGLAGSLEAEFDWKLDKESLLSLADEELLTRAILNLLTNAFVAAGKGGKVSLRLSVKGKDIRIIVADSGKGLRLPQGDEDPLLKTDEGLGLGLTAARRVATLHGGALVLENTEDAGVRSVLSLPIRQPEQGETLRRERMPYDHSGGFSTLLVEFAPLLPVREFLPENLD